MVKNCNADFRPSVGSGRNFREVCKNIVKNAEYFSSCLRRKISNKVRIFYS